ncbi:MAG: DUF3578 domain-containing protein [Pseudomonadota bacterium]
MSLSEMLTRVANEFVYARGKPFKNSEFGNFVRHDLAIEAKKHLEYWPFDMSVKASVGAGNWAAVPWLAFFDPLITDSATRGFYVVYLINAQDSSIVLSLNQGTTAVYQEFGRRKALEVLRRRAIDLRDRAAELSQKFSSETIDLGSDEELPQGYVAGHAFGKIYRRNDLIGSGYLTDLYNMLVAYSAIVERGGLIPTDLLLSEQAGLSLEESRRLALSRRIERSRKVRRAVLERKALICEACGLDPKQDYRFVGPPLQVPLDVHHITPLNTLSEGETKRYRIPEDFLVLCPTCHRMIHKQKNPSDLQTLKLSIRFKHMREAGW